MGALGDLGGQRVLWFVASLGRSQRVGISEGQWHNSENTSAG